MTTKRKLYLSLGLLALTLVMNAAGALGWIGGMSQAAVSKRYPTLITPQGYAFSIWSVIYLGLIASFIWLYLRRNRPYEAFITDKIAPFFCLSCLLNSLWIVAFSLEKIALSAVIIALFLLTLCFVLEKLSLYAQKNSWLLALTFGLYGGWVFIATVVNIAAALVQHEFKGLGLSFDFWAILVLFLAFFLLVYYSTKLKNASFPLPVSWALFAIYHARHAKGQHVFLKITALILAFLLVGQAAILFYKNRWHIIPGVSQAKDKTDR